MAKSVKPAIYKLKNIIVSVDGVEMADISEDDGITIAFDRENVSKQLDRNDGGIFSYKDGFPCKITIPVLQHSPWITALNLLITTGSMVSINVRDVNDYGSAVVVDVRHAMIQMPEISFGAEAGTRPYVFEGINAVVA